jgi:hypothetical protein
MSKNFCLLLITYHFSEVMDLYTQDMKLRLKNPLAASASPLPHTVEDRRRLEDAGSSAVVSRARA